jgi:Outer membrane protein beta-barrel domain
MKKILVMLLAGAATLCQAQGIDHRNKVHVGLKGGYNYSNVYDSQGETFEADSKLGLAAGFFVSMPIGRLIGFQPEILFAQRGFHGTGTLLGSSYKLTRTTSYIDVPLLFSLKPTKMISILAGPQFSYTLKQKDVFTNSATSFEQEEEFNNDNIRKNTLCFLGGFDINLHPVVLGIRVGWDLQKNNGDGTSSTIQYKNVWTQGTIGFRL